MLSKSCKLKIVFSKLGKQERSKYLVEVLLKLFISKVNAKLLKAATLYCGGSIQTRHATETHSTIVMAWLDLAARGAQPMAQETC
jgi:hypothetical protein